MSRLVPNTVLLGKYRVEHLLGQGAMGAVYAAHHIDLGERVAIKCLTEELMGAHGAVERFLREARAAHRLRNKHICQVFDVGRFENGAPYMVMEYLDGEDLMKRVERAGPLPIDLAAKCVAQAADALVEAHAAGIIHRDIKPANILLFQAPDGTPSVKVLDFGIAKLANEASVELTRTSTMIGSAMYMSPEQIRSAKHVDPRSDVWSLGVTLYRLLVAAAPFVAESIPELCVKVVSEAPRPPTDFRPEIPSELERVVLRCLQKDPANRYQSAAELRDALEPFTRHQAAPAGAFLDDAPTEMFASYQRDDAPPGIVPAAGARVPAPAAPPPAAFQPPPPPTPPAARPTNGSHPDHASPFHAASADAMPDGLIPSEQFTTVAPAGMMLGLQPGGGMEAQAFGATPPPPPPPPFGASTPNAPAMPAFGPAPNGFGASPGGFGASSPNMGGFGAPGFGANGTSSQLNGFPAPLEAPAAPAQGKKPTTEQLVVIGAAAAVLLLVIAAAARSFLGGSSEPEQPVVLAATQTSASASASAAAPDDPPKTAPEETTKEDPPPVPATAEPSATAATPVPPPPHPSTKKTGTSAPGGTGKKKGPSPTGTPIKKTTPVRGGPIPIKR